MGQQLHQRATRSLRRVALVAVLGAVVLVSGCSAQTQHEWKNLAMPDPATEQAEHTFYLWRWAWVAALVTGAIVWGLIFWCCIRYRKRRDNDDIPRQTKYNLFVELVCVVVPLVVIVGLFWRTVVVEDDVNKLSAHPDTLVTDPTS